MFFYPIIRNTKLFIISYNNCMTNEHQRGPAMMTTAEIATQTARQLQRELTAIAAEIAELKNEGLALQGYRFNLVAPGGTAGKASQKAPRYGRLTTGRGKEQRSRYVALKDIPATMEAVTRGQALTKLEKAQARTMAKLERARARAGARA